MYRGRNQLDNTYFWTRIVFELFFLLLIYMYPNYLTWNSVKIAADFYVCDHRNRVLIEKNEHQFIFSLIFITIKICFKLYFKLYNNQYFAHSLHSYIIII